MPALKEAEQLKEGFRFQRCRGCQVQKQYLLRSGRVIKFRRNFPGVLSSCSKHSPIVVSAQSYLCLICLPHIVLVCQNLADRGPHQNRVCVFIVSLPCHFAGHRCTRIAYKIFEGDFRLMLTVLL